MLPRIPWRHPAFALLLPLILLALGTWQLTRVTGAPAGYEARAASFETSIAKLRPLATRDPNARIHFGNNPREYTATEALTRLEAAQTEFHRDALIEQARVILAWLATVGGAIAASATLAGLAAVWAGARRGMRSRDALVAAFRIVVRMLPPLLGCVAVASALGVVGAILFEIGGAWFLESYNTGEIKLILLALALAAGALIYAVSAVRQLRGALEAFTPQPMQVLGRAATPAEAPGLWAFIQDIAARQGATTPDHIVLGLLKGFFVTSSQVHLAPEARTLAGRTLYLPAAMMPLLDRAEMSAVIAHELAHFTGEDTQYSLHFLPLFTSMARSMDAVAGRRRAPTKLDGLFQPAVILAHAVLDRFDRVVSHWSRLRELEADAASLRVGPGHHAASALVRTGVGAGLVTGALDAVYEHPDRAEDDIVAAVLTRAATVGFTDPARYLDDRQPHPTDSHPLTRQRIEALGVTIDDAFLAHASRPLQPEDPAWTQALFTDWPSFRQRLGADFRALATRHDQEFQAELEQAAAAVPQEAIPIHERSAAAIAVFTIIAALFLGAAAFAAYAATAPGWVEARDRAFIVKLAAGIAAIAAPFLLIAVLRYRRTKAGPFLTLEPTGFRCIGLDQPIPWSMVRDVRVTVGQAFVTTFVLNPDTAMPTRTGHRWSVGLDQRKRLITLKGYVPKGLKPQAYLDLITRALRAHRAQLLLRERENEAAQSLS